MIKTLVPLVLLLALALAACDKDPKVYPKHGPRGAITQAAPSHTGPTWDLVMTCKTVRDNGKLDHLPESLPANIEMMAGEYTANQSAGRDNTNTRNRILRACRGAGWDE